MTLRLEASCTRAVVLGAYSQRSVSSIPVKGLDQASWEQQPPLPPVEYDSPRGADYFAEPPSADPNAAWCERAGVNHPLSLDWRKRFLCQAGGNEPLGAKG